MSTSHSNAFPLENRDIESCCENYYNWEKDICIEASGGNVATSATGKWYVNYKDERCVQDCPEDGGGPCGGLAYNWDQLYGTVSDCCDSQLSWISAAECEARSTLTTRVGTGLFYVDWEKDMVR